MAARAVHPSEERKNDAEAEKFAAEAEKHRAERDYFNAEARRSVANAKQYEIVARAKLREEKDKNAQDLLNHVYPFDKSVSEASVKNCIQELTRWTRQDSKCSIELQLNSPGGTITDGFALIDFLRTLQDDGHEVTTIAYGMAASMAGVILQVGSPGKRIVGKHAFLLLHQGSLGAVGDFGDVVDRVELMKMYHEKILDLFVARAETINPKTTRSFIKRNWTRKDWWLTAEDTVKLGFADKIR